MVLGVVSKEKRKKNYNSKGQRRRKGIKGKKGKEMTDGKKTKITNEEKGERKIKKNSFNGYRLLISCLERERKRRLKEK